MPFKGRIGWGWGAPRRSIPVQQRHTQPQVRRVVVVVDQTLAVALEQLHVAAQVAGQREAPAESRRAVAAAAAAERMAQHHAELLSVPLAHDQYLAEPHVIAD